MTRTQRNVPDKLWLRRPHHIATHRIENQAIDELNEFGIEVGNRLKKRANPTSGEIPTAWDDIHISALEEVIPANGRTR